MYRELDNLLSAETTEDSWYDDGCIIASDILSDFRADDWGKLKNEALTKPLEWQKNWHTVWIITEVHMNFQYYYHYLVLIMKSYLRYA